MTTAPRRRGSAGVAVLLSSLLAFTGLTAAPMAAHAAPGDVTGAELEWGVKESFRTYITNIAHGVVTLDGVGSTPPYGWSGGTGAYDATAGTGSVAYPGSVRFQGHEGVGVPEGSYALDVTFSEVRIAKTGATSAQLIVDVVANSTSEPTEFTTWDDVVFAEVDLAAAASTGGEIVSYTGAPAVLTEAGSEAFSGFYAAGTLLDPVSFTWPVEQAPPPAPSIEVSKTAGFDPTTTETVTVSGQHFDPEGNLGMRPPVAGIPAGVYVVFGKFADDWKPSDGAPSSARTVLSQKWVLPQATHEAVVAEYGPNPAYVVMDADGSFELELPVAVAESANANYGIYVYPGGSAKNPAEELAVPISFELLPTAVAMAAAPASGVVEGRDVTLTATVTPRVEGEVTFRSGATTLGTAAVGGDGSARLTWPGATGSHELVAEFAPAADDVYADATSSELAYVVTAKPSPRAGYLSWGIKSSFREYVVGPIADGSVRVGGGAGIVGGAYRFPQTDGGTFDADTGRGSADFRGSVAFSGHGGALELSLSSPRVRISNATTGALSVVVAGTGRVDFASLALGGGTRAADSSGAVAYTAVPVTLTAAGASAFEGFYSAGTPLDPVSFVIGSAASAGLAPAVVGSSTAVVEDDEWTPPADLAGLAVRIAEADSVGCAVEDATLTWGFKETFRAYIDGSIANGEWIVGDGAEYTTPDFVFSGGEGGYDPGQSGGDIAFPGSIRFTGHGGALDTTVANPEVRFLDGTTAVLLLDVHGETQQGDSVEADGVEFAELDLAAAEWSRDGTVVTIADAPATLTASGSDAFGTYDAGEALDPVTLTIALPADCAAASPEPTASAEPEAEESETASDAGWVPWTLVGLLVLAAIVALVVVALRRRASA